VSKEQAMAYIGGDEIEKYGFDQFVHGHLNALMEAIGSPVRFSVEEKQIFDACVNPGALIMTDYYLIAHNPMEPAIIL